MRKVGEADQKNLVAGPEYEVTPLDDESQRCLDVGVGQDWLACVRYEPLPLKRVKKKMLKSL